MASFEWDEAKNRLNQDKHGVAFELAQAAFFDSKRLIARDISHRGGEERYYCIGTVGQGVLTVRFTMRGRVICIIGAKVERRMKKRIQYSDEPMELRIVADFLPPPNQLRPKRSRVKVTVEVAKESLEFYRSQTRGERDEYRAMMGQLLDLYATRFAKSKAG